MTRISKRSQAEVARRQGYTQGLRHAHTMINKARNSQARLEKLTDDSRDPDLKENYKHAANCLHDLCLKFQEAIAKASAK